MLINSAYIKSPGPQILDLFFLNIRWYGLLIAISVLIGLFISKRLAKLKGIDPESVSDLLPSLVLSSIIGARSYYVIFEWKQFSGNNFFSSLELLNYAIKIPSFLAIWEGGIAIHGALIGGFVSIFLFCKVRKIPLRSFLDIIVPSVVLGQSVGRWGNFFNNEAFGIPTNLPWKLFIPIENRPIEFLNYQFFHPTFLYESIWNLLIFLLLMILIRSQRKGALLKPGLISCIYLITYSFGRFWIEALRTDPLCVGATPPLCEGGLRIAQFISIFLFSSGIIGTFFLNFKSYKEN